MQQKNVWMAADSVAAAVVVYRHYGFWHFCHSIGSVLSEPFHRFYASTERREEKERVLSLGQAVVFYFWLKISFLSELLIFLNTYIVWFIVFFFSIFYSLSLFFLSMIREQIF